MLEFRECLEKVGIKSKDDIYDLQDPTSNQLIRTLIEIRKRLKAGLEAQPQENILVICMFACHGILKEGVQNIVFNQFDSRKGYYKMVNVED